MSSTRSLTKKLMLSNYVPLETIQLVPETFFNIISNKRDIPGMKRNIMNSTVQNIRLSSGYLMPTVGFGTYKIQGKDTIYEVINESLKTGFRSIDTATVYRNEDDIGSALKHLLPKYHLQRSDIFITTKLSPSENGNPDGIKESVQRSLKALNTTYIDLYLIHWPGATRIPENSPNNPILRAKTWETLVDLKKQGFIKSIGVSNYTINHLEELLHDCKDVPPAVNQVECHPHYRQEELIKYCNEKGIHVQAYSSLGTSGTTNLLRDPVVTCIATQLNVSPARLLLKWALQQGIGVIPKAVKKEHIRDNIQLNFTIDEVNMNSLSSLPQQKYAWDPFNEGMEQFSDQIARLCIKKYETLGKNGKPTNREWTVLSGIVLKKQSGSLSLLALATGTKCLGELDLANRELYEEGSRLSDSHAEILTRRAFLRYLHEQIDLLLTNSKSDVFSMDDEKNIKLNHGISFHFFTSQTPCGDCSIFLKDFQEDVPPTKMKKYDCSVHGDIVVKSNTNGTKDEIIKDIYRTGAKCVNTESNQDPHLSGVNYHVLGPLRTKPGRGNPTLSLSCSDKMAKWNILGLQGALLSILIPPIKLATIIIGGNCPFSSEAIERGLHKRFNKEANGLKIVQANIAFQHQKNDERKSPCPSSIIWCAVRNRDIEIAVEGRKQGATKKRKGYLLVTRRALFASFLRICDKYKNCNIRHPKKLTYLDCKKWSRDYQNSWNKLKSESFHAWPSKPTHLQMFVL